MFLDLDGVLCNFVKQSQIVHGKLDVPATKWNYFEDWGINVEQFWSKIDSTADFWESLEPYPWMNALMGLVSSYDENFYILTAPHNHPNSYSGKCRWISCVLGLDPTQKAIFTHAKHLVADPNRILIDDNPRNIEDWQNSGGYGILFPQPWSMTEHVEDKVDYIYKQLEVAVRKIR